MMMVVVVVVMEGRGEKRNTRRKSEEGKRKGDWNCWGLLPQSQLPIDELGTSIKTMNDFLFFQTDHTSTGYNICFPDTDLHSLSLSLSFACAC